MAFTSLEDRLTKIRDAIDALIEQRATEVQVGETRYRLLDIHKLEELERRIEARISRQNNGGRMLIRMNRPGAR